MSPLTGGAITLDEPANAFNTLTVSTTGSYSATIYDYSAVTVASADVGGTFTLTSGGTIGQSGAIIANALDVTSTGGAITLTNSGNAFSTLTVSTTASDGADIYDPLGVTSRLGHCRRRLHAGLGGAIGQSGAIIANALIVSSTGGAITLDHTGNSFNTLTVSTTGSYGANIYDALGRHGGLRHCRRHIHAHLRRRHRPERRDHRQCAGCLLHRRRDHARQHGQWLQHAHASTREATTRISTIPSA